MPLKKLVNDSQGDTQKNQGHKKADFDKIFHRVAAGAHNQGRDLVGR